MNIGIIGIGNMGEAILSGLLKGKVVGPQQVYVFDASRELMQLRQEQYGMHLARDYQNLLEVCEYLILTVKPNVYPQVLAEISPYLDAKHFILSIAPGFDVERLKGHLPDDFDKIVLFMSNTAAKIGKAITAAAFSPEVNEQNKEKIIRLFESFGSFLEIDEKQLPAITSVIGSAPAIVYMLIESLMQGAVLEGIPARQAQELAAHIVASSAAMVLENNEHPAILRDRICSPAGTTIEGVAYLEKEGFSGSIIEAIHRIAEKAGKMKK